MEPPLPAAFPKHHVFQHLMGLWFLLSETYKKRKILKETDPSAVFWFDGSGRYVDVRWQPSTVAWKLTKNIIGKNCSHWLPPRSGDKLRQLIGQCLKDRLVHETTVSFEVFGVWCENTLRLFAVERDLVMAIMRQKVWPV